MADDKAMEMVGSSPIHDNGEADGHESHDQNGSESKEASGTQSQSKSGSLERYLSLKPMVAFGLTLQSTWEGIGVTFQASLLNGGPASMVYGMIFAALGSSALAMSLAEMASMDPVVGAQYRWTALYAPGIMTPEFWSLLQGWLTVFAWIAACAITPFLLGTLVQGLIIFNYPTYTPAGWHGTLLAWAFVLIPVLWNIYARRLLVVLELIGGVCHIFFFICTVIVLGVMAKRSPPSFVFQTLTHDVSGWDNPCAAFSIGLLTAVSSISGFDGVLHMSAEVKDPSRRVPRSIIMTVVINSIVGWGFIICLLFTLGNFEKVSASPTGFPIIEVYYEATKSVAGTNIMMAMLIIVISVSDFSIFASVSRLLWAFARDKGLPFSEFFSYIHPTLHIPTNSLALVATGCCLLALINIGSTTAFYAILSLASLALYISYIIPITLFMIRKLQNRHPSYGPFCLGRYGIPINLFAIMYACYIAVWMTFPVVTPISAATMNYAGPVWFGVFIFALVDWFTSGKKRFKVPVKHNDLSYDLND